MCLTGRGELAKRKNTKPNLQNITALLNNEPHKTNWGEGSDHVTVSQPTPPHVVLHVSSDMSHTLKQTCRILGEVLTMVRFPRH